MKVYLGDSNRQPQTSRENLEWHSQTREVERQKEREREKRQIDREGEQGKKKKEGEKKVNIPLYAAVHIQGRTENRNKYSFQERDTDIRTDGKDKKNRQKENRKETGKMAG